MPSSNLHLKIETIGIQRGALSWTTTEYPYMDSPDDNTEQTNTIQNNNHTYMDL